MAKQSKPFMRFEVNFIFKFSLIIRVHGAEYARRDAYNVLESKYGHSATIKGAGVALSAVPEGAQPLKNCDWAWIVE